ncbi:hypothetical protein MJO28_002298 [Puccinia striiformis f. sp. tritici]|uniref:Uncharacterized protein n=1 Tax=Puccinia striiformis f. sp. tritici TaxID=168172 RepID=A0ACC0EXL8_9BASI|nr:hypothetical protein MJO28_002298 [Puccinia striiformis f. sp. tritici]
MESPMKGIDTTSSCTSEAFDNLFAPLLERTIAPLKRALAQANIKPFELKLCHSNPSKLPGSINPFITHYVVRNVGPKAMGRPSSVKIKAKIKYSGLVLLKGAVAYEEVQIEAAPADSGKEAKPTKKTVKKELSAFLMYSSLDRPALDHLLAREGDKIVLRPKGKQMWSRNMSNLIFNKPPPKLTANPDATMLWVTGSGTLCH